MRHPTPPPMINNVQHPMSSSAAPHTSSNVPLLMSNNAAHPMRLATRLNAPQAMNNNARLFMRQAMSSNVLPLIQKNALVVTEAMVDMARSARRFPSKAARVSQCRPLPNSALRSLRRTANRFQSKFPRKSVSRCLSRHQQKFQDRSVRSKDMDMAID